MKGRIFTVGHSTHELRRFVDLLRWNDVGAVCDVRSVPRSRFVPHFNREHLSVVLERYGIQYFFLGKELGARPADKRAYESGRVDYERLAALSQFQDGLERLGKIHKAYAPALLCAERDPLHCHRTILVARHLVSRGYSVEHILHSGDLETHQDALSRLIRTLKISGADMLRARQAVEDEAYRLQGEAIAFREERGDQQGRNFAAGSGFS